MEHHERTACPKLTGRIVSPGEPGYSEARLDSNFYYSKDKFPTVIVYCQDTHDVQNAVRWARCHEVPIRVRSGGHHHEAFSTGTGVIVIDVSEMKQVRINKSKGIATVQAGNTGQELYSKLYESGLTQVGGTCAEVGISGLLLSGGMGPLLRRHGLTCDSLVALEMVDANGRVIHATENNEHKDLFWASRGGGGGNFGILTSMTIKVYPAKPVTWFNIGWDWNQPVEEVIDTWQNFFLRADIRWFSHLDLWSKLFPSEQFDKLPLKAMGVFWGTPEEARWELTPLLNVGRPSDQTIELVSWDQAIKNFEVSNEIFITSKPEYKSSGAYAMRPLPPEAIKIIRKTLEDTTSPLLNVLIYSLGGAFQDTPPTGTAFYYREAKFFIQYYNQWLEDEEAPKRKHELESLRRRLLPYTKGDYVGNPDSEIEDYLTAYYGGNVDRLRYVKGKYDPYNVFCFEQSIPPAPKAGSWL
ncbi:FAD-binding oxidoreductase [Ectobacillus funiculus]|uniref:FAD-binding oxidoreductase n=1 Tax=Ectobacillus funiculus TaxID=137993 RepID=UPI003979D48B